MSEAARRAPAARLTGVSKSFGEKVVLDGVDLEVARGETAVVMGRSGSGKSVLLKILDGLLAPDAGSVQLLGVEVTTADAATKEALRKRTAFLFQGGALFDSLSVFDNVAFPLRERTEKGEDEIAEIVRERLADCGLTFATAEKFPSELSGGMRKRVALARALALSPEVLLYDEPTTGLDPITAASVGELIVEMGERFGTTQVVVTHDMSLAFSVATTMHLLYKGRIIAHGAPEALRAHEDPRVAQFVSGATEGPIAVLEDG